MTVIQKCLQGLSILRYLHIQNSDHLLRVLEFEDLGVPVIGVLDEGDQHFE